MKAEAKTRHAPVKAAMGQLAMALADQMEAGKLDRCAAASQIDVLAAATAKAHPGDRADFEKLHAILDPGQRTAFVQALKQEHESIEKMHEPSALADKIAEKLSMGSEQKASLQAILTGLREIRQAEPAYAVHRERWAKILDAFQGDHFVLDDVAPMGDVAVHTRERVEQRIWAGEAIYQLLSTDQRKAVAGKLRDWASKAGSESGTVSPSMSPDE
jgi:hypothetical protein